MTKDQRPVVEPKIRAIKNEYVEVESRKKELTSRFRALAKDCKHKCLSCYIQYCPIIINSKR